MGVGKSEVFYAVYDMMCGKCSEECGCHIFDVEGSIEEYGFKEMLECLMNGKLVRQKDV